MLRFGCDAIDLEIATCWQTSGTFGSPTNAWLSPRLRRRAVRNARSRCDWSDERHGSARCPSFLRLSARPAACLIPRRHDGHGSRYNVGSHCDRHGRGLEWARSLVLAKVFSLECPLFTQSGHRRCFRFGPCPNQRRPAPLECLLLCGRVDAAYWILASVGKLPDMPVQDG